MVLELIHRINEIVWSSVFAVACQAQRFVGGGGGGGSLSIQVSTVMCGHYR